MSALTKTESRRSTDSPIRLKAKQNEHTWEETEPLLFKVERSPVGARTASACD